jgi:hypothetical protein
MYDEASPEELAQLIHRVLSDGGLKATVLASQRSRIGEITARRVDDELDALLRDIPV